MNSSVLSLSAWRRVVVAVVAVALAACASPPPPWPAGFEAAQTEFRPDPARPAVSIEGPAGKVGGMFRGAAWGGGIGLMVGLLGEVGCTWVCGASTVFGALIGGGSGAIGGAIAAEHEADVDAKRRMLEAALAAQPVAQQLVDALRAGSAAAGGAAAWTATAAVTGLETVGHGAGVPYALRLRASLELRSGGAPGISREFDVVSGDPRTTAGWQADGGAALRAALDACVRSLAAQMLTSMRQSGPSRP